MCGPFFGLFDRWFLALMKSRWAQSIDRGKQDVVTSFRRHPKILVLSLHGTPIRSLRGRLYQLQTHEGMNEPCSQTVDSWQ